MNPYLAKIENALADAKAILDSAVGGEMSADELTQYEAHLDSAEEFKALSDKFEKNAKRLAAFEAPVARKTAPATPRVEVGETMAAADPMKGFTSPRDFFSAVMDANKTGKVDARLNPLAAAGSDEQQTQADPYGGFLIPETMQPDVKSITPEGDPTIGRTTVIPMASPTVKINARVDKNHTSSVSGGLSVSRTPETAAVASSRMQLEQVSLSVNKLSGLSYVSDELMKDSPVSVAAMLAQGYEQEFGSHLLNEKLNGGGVGEYEGVFNSPAILSVAKEGSQAADTIVMANILKMYQALYGKDNGMWLMNHNCFAQIAALTGATTGNGQLVWQRDAQEKPRAFLLGLPIYYSEHMETLGDKGDILLADWSQYLDGTYQTLESASSTEVRFVESETAFKFSMRNDARTWWRSTLTPKKGTTMSPFVTLAARA